MLPALRRTWSLAYFAGWALAAGGALGLAATCLWAACGISEATGIDGDVSLLGIPAGAWLGLLAARTTRHSRRTHRALVGLGAAVAGLATFGAAELFAQSEAMHGQGPFAGLGEAIAGYLAVGIAATGVALALTGLFGSLASPPSDPT